MKHCFYIFATLLTLACICGATAPITAQTTNGFGYQAAVYDKSGKIVAAKTVSAHISIAQASDDGAVVYSETHTTNTNDKGFINIIIGQGDEASGSMSSIKWGKDNYFLRCDITPNGDKKHTFSTVQQIVSAPRPQVAEGSQENLLHIIDSLEQALDESCECDAAGVDATRTVKIDNGALPGIFSVSKSQKVHFSMGNLQYQASKGKWRFAKTQIDIIGEGNNNISSSNRGWIDLFTWGTSGYHDNSDPQNTQYQPYSVSTEWNEKNRYNGFGYGPSSNKGSGNLTEDNAKYDWGIFNAIDNGGGKEGLWRTLTHEEWEYLLNTRSTEFIYEGTTYDIRYCMANVAGRSGIILFPDNYSMPAGIPIPKSYNVGGDFSVFALSDVMWNILESAGAVFLPAAGYRVGKTFYGSANDGYYWSASHEGSDYAYRVVFGVGFAGASSTGGRFDAFAVRLVQGL
ncbi:MAG: hypothetical protein IJ764_00825 [Bacteroidales bacterium]|nr:hypothetical protein [Bacteroidales bacterium]